jgi:hypothetical protein
MSRKKQEHSTPPEGEAGPADQRPPSGNRNRVGSIDDAGSVPTWKTIALGTCRSVTELHAALKAAGMNIGDLAEEALDQLTLAGEAMQVDLVVRSGVELGITAEDTTLAEAAERAKAVGLALCPAEVGPQLRLQYPDQPLGEFLRIAMAPLATEHGAVGFTVGNGGAGLLLIGNDSHPDRPLAAILHFVFVRSAEPRERRP